MGQKSFYVTTAIVYVNANPHIGFAYEVIAADVLSRYKRMQGYDVFFLTGSDEHAINVYKNAIANKMQPLEYCNQLVNVYKEVWRKLNITNDFFIRTTDKYHEACAQYVVKKLYEKGDIYKASYEGWYCQSCEAFLQEKDLVDKKCPIHGKEPEWLKEENYFFKLTKYRDDILNYIEKNPAFIQPDERRNEILSVLNSGLNDISISRSSQKWGIPFPLDNSHVIYVWFDALLNYISAIGYPDNINKFNNYWPADVHVIGKDIIRFHCVIWPAILMSLGLSLPERIQVHGMLKIGGAKISKTSGNIIDPSQLADKFGVDTLRYFLMKEIPFGSDGNFSEELMIRRRNAELADDLGNLVSRTLSMIEKYCSSVIPQYNKTAGVENILQEKAIEIVNVIDRHFDALDFSNALAKIWELVKLSNQFIDKQAPWTLAKNQETNEKLKTVLYYAAESIRQIAVLIYPFVPSASENIYEQLGIPKKVLAENLFEDLMKWGQLVPGKKVNKGNSLFPKLESPTPNP